MSKQLASCIHLTLIPEQQMVPLFSRLSLCLLFMFQPLKEQSGLGPRQLDHPFAGK